MGFNITVPWKIHLNVPGSRGNGGRSWWTRRKFHDDPGAHPTLMDEQDLDHLGTLHENVSHAKRR